MRRPVAYAATIVIVLLALGAPFLHVTWGGTDARVLPAAAQARVVTEALNRDFAGNPTAPIESLVSFHRPDRRFTRSAAPSSPATCMIWPRFPAWPARRWPACVTTSPGSTFATTPIRCRSQRGTS